ncbi:ABC transporter ATP-binding protein [Paenibacillus lutrae]|uniref:ATP-binding cassette domain-containing protein n=1 Tax=Paenibacillus lutrae TaxID=2078573 RepID=A0A7X3FL30_9BACL|nr:ATP-binding cassette domain-containing protein [Paenibacillus lutrae]MVP01605.1 ATP-binding cassette domain-containing protein [Paenibacillus lutrae]
MLEVNGVSKLYENSRGVSGINFTMQRGEIVGFLGPNGAGKTTTMRMITGYLNPTSGSIRVNGLSMADHPRKARRTIGYLPETPPLYPEMTVRAYLKFVADLRDVPARDQKRRIGEIMEKLGLGGREHQIIRSLSKGYKQRLGLAQAIVHQPDLLVLDEPTSGLDPKQIIEIRRLIRELGENHTVLLSTHILPEVNALCNRVLIINQGQIVLDEKPELLGRTMGDTFEVSLEVKGPREDVVRLLGGTPGVAAVEVLGGDESINAAGVGEADARGAAAAGELSSDKPEAEAEGTASSLLPVSPAPAGERPRPLGASALSSSGECGGAEDASHTGEAEVPADGTVKLRVSAAGSTDIREPVFFRLAEAGYPILEMKRESLSLEEIFLKLTTDEKLAGSGSADEADSAAQQGGGEDA